MLVVVRAAGTGHLFTFGSAASSTTDRGPCRCAGVTNGWWDVGPSSPAIRERACPAQAPTPGPGSPLPGRDRHTFDDDRRILVAVFCGIDWAEDHHDIALVDQDGTLLTKRRIGDDTAGFAALLQLLVEAGDDPEAPIPVAIETSHGLLVACLRATGRPVFPINPMSVSRYRDRHSVARRKSDAGRTPGRRSRPRRAPAPARSRPADSEL